VSSRSEPKLLGVVDTAGTALQASVEGDIMAVADWNDVRVYNVADPANPLLRATERIASDSNFPRVLGVALQNGVVYAGEWTGFYALRFHPERSAQDVFTFNRTLEFGNVNPGQQDALALIVGNQGTEPLVAFEVKVSGPFTIDKDETVIRPGALEVFELVFDPTTTDQQNGVLEIWSDDPDDKPLRAEIVGNRPGFGVGDNAPEVGASLLGGGSWKLSEQRGQVVVLAYFATF
jgi:hypothetical protein